MALRSRMAFTYDRIKPMLSFFRASITALGGNLRRATASSAAAVRSPPPPTNNDLPMTNVDEKKIAVGWSTQAWSRFHNIWLRDHCRCPTCFHPVTKQRFLNTFEIPADIRPLHVEAQAEGLQVLWPSSASPHESIYPWPWLKRHSYDPPLSKETVTEKILWSSKIQQSPPTVTYSEVMDGDDKGLFKWLSNIDRFGFSFVSGVPETTEDTERLCQRIGFIRETQYGKFWEFTSNMEKGDTAYTSLALGAHTDNTYFTDPCGLQLFHLLSHKNGTGGATLLVDGFYVASILKELHPEAYSLLSKVPIPAHAAGESDSFYRPTPASGYPVLNHSSVTKELYQVRWNNDDRSVISSLEAGQVEEWYNAIRLWNSLLTSPDSQYWIQLKPGMAVIVDNHRVLHGRSAFDGERRMCGAYIGVDEYKSKLVVLSDRFEGNTERSVWSPLL